MSFRTSASVLALAALFSPALVSGAFSAQIGEAASVIPASSYTRGANERTLAIRDTLEQNDRIRTTGAGSTRVRFLDDTMLTIGPNSEVLLDEFVFDGNRAQKATVQVVRGAMRFVSGTSDRRAYEIKTPVATIGVRGTVVDIGVVNGRWSFNTVDGQITATLPNGQTRTFNAGQPGFSVGPTGFIPLNPNDAAQLWRRLDGAHLALAKAAGQNPSAPQGAAAGGVTGGTPGGNQNNQNQQSNNNSGPGSTQGGPGSGSNSGPAFSTPPPVNVVATTGTTTGVTNVAAPAFIANPLSFGGVGGGESVVDAEVASNLNRALVEPSMVVWDSTNGSVKSVVMKGTAPGVIDPNAVTLERTTATVAELYTDPSTVPLYQIGRWTNGQITATQNNVVVVDETLTANQGLHYIIFGHTNGLYDINNQFKFGQIVTYSLEQATKPTWINSQSAPGTFTGQLAVVFGTMVVSYGLEGTLAMTEGNISISTTGGITSPHLSGAVGSTRGGIETAATALLTGNGSGGPCAYPTVCLGIVDFVPVASTKVGVFYALDVGTNSNSPLIEGAAVFGNPSAPANPTSGELRFLFTDTEGFHYLENQYLGTAQISGSNVLINSFSDGINTTTRLTASSADAGNDKTLGWERWTGGTYQNNSDPPVTIPVNAGMHFIHGVPNTFGPGMTTAAKVEYSLVGSTSPTIWDGSVAPGSLGSGSKMSVDFANSKIGLDLFVSIGAANYHVHSLGGASTPSSSTVNLLSNGYFGDGSLNVALQSGTTLPTCTIGTCEGSVTGFLSGYESSQAGLVYTFGDSILLPAVTGAAAFNRNFPVSNIGAAGYADYANAANNQMLMGTINDFNSTSGSLADHAVIADNTQTSGLSVQRFDLEVSTPKFGWHRLYGSQSVDQGVIAGALGWERFIGDVHQHSNVAGPNIPLGLNQGVHIIHGVAATNIPTNASYTYNLVGGTTPTTADGAFGGGSILNTSKVGVDFSSTAPKVGVSLDIAMGGVGGQYKIESSGGALAPSLAANSIHSNGTFNASSIPTSHTGGTNNLCSSGCTGAVSGFLAGDQAKHLGIIYQFGNNTTPDKVVTGAAGFSR